MPEPEPFNPEDFINQVLSGGKVKTPLGDFSEAELIKALQAGILGGQPFTEQQLREELTARKLGALAIEDAVQKARAQPTPATATTPARSAIRPPSLPGGAGYGDTSLGSFTEAEIIDQFPPEEAYRILVEEKGLAPAVAELRIRKALAAAAEKEANKKVDPLKTPEGQSLVAKGIGPSLSAQDYIKGAEQGLWSPDDAEKALITFKGLLPQEAVTVLKMRGWIQGGGGTGLAAGYSEPGVAPPGVQVPQPNQPPQPPPTVYDAVARQMQTAVQQQPQATAGIQPMRQIAAPTQDIYNQVAAAYARGEDPGLVYRGLTGVIQ